MDLPAKGTEAPVARPPAGGEDFVVVAEDPLGLAVEQRLVDLGLVSDGNPHAGQSGKTNTKGMPGSFSLR